MTVLGRRSLKTVKNRHSCRSVGMVVRWSPPLLLLLLITAVGGQFFGVENGVREYHRAGTNLTLPCRVAHNGHVHRLEWWKEDRKMVVVQEGRRTHWDAKPHVSLEAGSGLAFRPVAYADSGEYQCVVNEKPSKDGVVKLFVQDIPEPPGMSLIMGFTSRSVNLSWAPSVDNRNSPILHYIIHVRVGEMGHWDVANGIVTADNRTSYQVVGLQPYTVYSFRVLAVNAIGTGKPSKESYYMVTLREVPDGKPTIAEAHNSSSSAIRLQWAPPPEHTIHGEFLGYKINYWPRDKPEHRREIVLYDPTVKHYTIRNLETFTQYLISLQVFNPAGKGPATSIPVMTDEGVPSPPRNLTVIRVTDKTAKIQWSEPSHPNSIIKSYNIYLFHLAHNTTSKKQMQVSNPQPSMEYVLEHLEPFVRYKVWVKAFTGKTEGEPSNYVQIKTDVDGPDAPSIVNLTCQTLDSLYLQWQQPKKFYNKIDYYYVYYRAENSFYFQEKEIEAAFDRTDHATFIPNLTANTMYEVKVQGATLSIIEGNKIYKGDTSDPRKVILQERCTMNGGLTNTDGFLTAGMIAGVVCVSFALLLAIVSFVLWRKYFQAAYYYLDDPPGNRASPQLSETFDDSEYTSVPVNQWVKHVNNLHADGDIGFSREYEAIQHSTDLDLSSEHSQLVENKGKNRYVNIVAYDHTRVVLKGVPGQKKTPDYINANYIDGYDKSRAYIGTQGPLPATFDDYWRMIWEQRVHIVVMITNLVERGRRKCDMYWPKEGAETYGIIQIRMTQEVVMATYTMRTFLIRNVKIKKKQVAERNVLQYHYTNWPDHGVPEHSLPVLSFVRKSSAANPPHGGPIIVHCSAGVGRTGTYIVLDAMLKQIKHKQSVNVFGFLKHIRQQRNYLVQTEEQYIFIHDALVEAIENGDTEVPCSQVPRYLQTLQTTDGEEKSSWPILEKQYRLVTSFKAKDFNVVSALKPCNKAKNRSLNLIPIESFRVHITPKPGTDGSDYINATFLHGFNKLREFIITQHPLHDTTTDFWQMVWDHNSQTVVLLSAVSDKEFTQFWPDKGQESDYGSFKLKAVEEGTPQGCYITRDFILQSTQDDYELACRLIQCAGWPECCSPLASVFELVNMVQEWHLEYQNGPMIVIDRLGGTEAATFCCLTTLFKQLQYENSVDVYMCAKLYHIRRPGIWRSQDDYLFLYRAVDSSLCDGQPNGHLNSNGHAVLPPKGETPA